MLAGTLLPPRAAIHPAPSWPPGLLVKRRTSPQAPACGMLWCEAAAGAARLGFDLRVLKELQRRGIVQLPPKRGPGGGPQKPLQFDERAAPQPPVCEPLARLVPVR